MTTGNARFIFVPHLGYCNHILASNAFDGDPGTFSGQYGYSDIDLGICRMHSQSLESTVYSAIYPSTPHPDKIIDVKSLRTKSKINKPCGNSKTPP